MTGPALSAPEAPLGRRWAVAEAPRGAGRALVGLWADGSLRGALFAFGLTRALILGLLVITTQVVAIEPRLGGAIHEARIVAGPPAEIARALRSVAYTADGDWYLRLARQGYDDGPADLSRPRNWAFFPLYPLLVRLLTSLTGMFAASAVLLSNGCFLIALVLLHKLTRAYGADRSAADRAVFYVASFPTSYFFSLAVTESLFLALAVGSIFAARRDAWWAAGLLAGLASATRFVGIALGPTLALLYWQRRGRAGLRADLAALLLAPIGLVAYMAYLQARTGDALAFATILPAWGRSVAPPWQPLLEYLEGANVLTAGWNLRPLNSAAAVLGLGCALALLRRGAPALGLYTLLAVLAPLSSASLMSMTRYVMSAFPIYLVLAQAGRRPSVDAALRTISAALLGILTVLYAARITLAMA